MNRDIPANYSHSYQDYTAQFSRLTNAFRRLALGLLLQGKPKLSIGKPPVALLSLTSQPIDPTDH